MTDTAKLVERLRVLHENATSGPWYRLDPPWLPRGCETSILAESPDPHVARWICDFDFPMMDEHDRLSECADADADLIIAVRNALPDLLAALTQSEARRKADVAEAVAAERERCGRVVLDHIAPETAYLSECLAAIRTQQETEHG